DGKWLVAECPLESKPGHSDPNRRYVTYAWELATGKPLSLAEPFNRLAFSGDGRFVLAAWSANSGRGRLSDAAVVHDLRTGQRVGTELRFPGDSFDRARLSRDGKVAVIVDEDARMMRVYSVADGRCTIARRFRTNGLAAAISPDGKQVALRDGADGFTGIAELREVASGRLVAPPLPTPDWADRLQFSADGRLLAVAVRSSLRLLDTDTGLPVGPWLPMTYTERGTHELPAFDFCFSAGGAA